MIGQMVVAIALRGCYDLGCLVTPTVLFFPGTYFYLQLPPHYPKMNKETIWEVKKNSRFLSARHHILPSYDCKACETKVAKWKLVL